MICNGLCYVSTCFALVSEAWKALYARLYSDIHSAGFALDPEFWHLEPNTEACHLGSQLSMKYLVPAVNVLLAE